VTGVSPSELASTPLLGQVAVVTGSTHGIGAVIAKRLAAAGASVVINGPRTDADARNVVDDVTAAGGVASFVEADLVGATGAGQLVDGAIAAYGRLDIFVTNAGVALWVEPGVGPRIEQVTEADFDRVFAVNTRGVFFALQAAARAMSDGGRIINISSSTTLYPNSGFSVYAGSKAAPLSFTDVLAQELGPRRITVNSVILGPIAAGFLQDASAEVIEMLSAQSPLGRVGTAEDGADVVAFLASDAARWISGQRIVVNGAAGV
jgi:3-oxoacyl-[acyl-carrier protein] reductase